MTSLDSHITKKINELSRNIRKKYRTLKLNRSEENVELNRIFKPITEPLKKHIARQKPKKGVDDDNDDDNNDKDDDNNDNDDDNDDDDDKKTTLPTKRGEVILKKKEDSPKYAAATAQPNWRNRSEVSFLPTESIGEFDTTTADDDDDSIFTTETSIAEQVSPTAYEEYLNDYPRLARSYIDRYIRDVDKNKFDTTYGITHDHLTNKWLLGKDELDFDHQKDQFTIKGRTFKGTRGLYELLFMKDPHNYTLEDSKHYKKILELTNVHKTGFSSTGKLRSSKNPKYTSIIKPTIDRNRLRAHTHTGAALHYNDKPIEYVYWDDINELVDRLRLLIASQRAGNTSHSNEIESIISELKETGIIY